MQRAVVGALAPLSAALAANPLPTEVRRAETVERRPVAEANQGIAVDNRTIAKS